MDVPHAAVEIICCYRGGRRGETTGGRLSATVTGSPPWYSSRYVEPVDVAEAGMVQVPGRVIERAPAEPEAVISGA